MSADLSASERGRPGIARVCVTGGAGMIGRRLVSRLAGRGIAVAVVDDLSSGLAMPAAATITHQCDIREASEMFALMKDFRPDAVVHLAAMHHIPTCENDRARCLDINVVGTENVLNAATEVQAERIVLASSGAVYDWSDGPLREDISPTMARDNYALAKLSNESQLRLWCEYSGGIGRVARIFNAIGGDDPNAHLLPDILAQLRGSHSISTVQLGNLESRRDYLHADEVADGMLAVLMDHRPQPFEVFNLCSGEEHSVEGLVDCLATCLGRSFRIEVDEARRRRGDRPSQLGDPNKTSALLGWRAKRDLRGVLEHLLAERSLA